MQIPSPKIRTGGMRPRRVQRAAPLCLDASAEGLRGAFQNEGSTCYLNSLFQALLHVKDVRSAIREHQPGDACPSHCAGCALAAVEEESQLPGMCASSKRLAHRFLFEKRVFEQFAHTIKDAACRRRPRAHIRMREA